MSPNDLRARMQSVAARPPQPIMPAESPTTDTRTHRVTVDLDDHDYAILREVAYRWHVPGSAVLRGLLTELGEDEDLAGRVQARAKQRT